MKKIIIDATIDYIKGYSQCQQDTDQQTKELREEIERLKVGITAIYNFDGYSQSSEFIFDIANELLNPI